MNDTRTLVYQKQEKIQRDENTLRIMKNKQCCNNIYRNKHHSNLSYPAMKILICFSPQVIEK